MSGDTYLSLQGIDAGYGRTKVLESIDLSIGKGEFVALLGASGCGKTTLLRTIAGFAVPSAGRIHVGARELMCIGAKPPFDHPHVFLDMGADSEIVCPYCSTLYKYDSALKAGDTEPAGCAWHAARVSSKSRAISHPRGRTGCGIVGSWPVMICP